MENTTINREPMTIPLVKDIRFGERDRGKKTNGGENIKSLAAALVVNR
jgi:hypothetical protein